MLVLDAGDRPRRHRRARRTRGSTIIRRSARIARLAGRGAAAHRGHAEAEAARAALRWVRRRRASGARRTATADHDVRSAVGAARFARGRTIAAGDDARRARPQLARARRADDGARGSVSGHGRRGGASRPPRRSPISRRVDAGSDRGRPGARQPDRSPSDAEHDRVSRRGTDRGRRASCARVSLPTWILPLARMFATHRRRGPRAPATRSRGRSIFAANHQSHIDGPVILAGAAAALALPRRAGDGEGVLQGALLPGAVHARQAVVHQQPELLPRPRCSSTRSRCRSARPARGRRCATSASSSATATRS